MAFISFYLNQFVMPKQSIQQSLNCFCFVSFCIITLHLVVVYYFLIVRLYFRPYYYVASFFLCLYKYVLNSVCIDFHIHTYVSYIGIVPIVFLDLLVGRQGNFYDEVKKKRLLF